MRLSLWRRICRELRPNSFAGWLCLVGSAMFDPLRFSIAPRSVLSPQPFCRLLLYAPRLDAHFLVRKNADDIYNILPFREMDVHDAILGNLRLGDVFVDGGANVGYYSILGAKAVGPSGTVVAIEAVQATAKQLAHNLKLNGIANTLIVNKAIQGNPDAEAVELEIPIGHFGMASFVISDKSGHFNRLKVDATTIDNICNTYDHIRLIKLDVEGAELAALMGARRTLAKTDYVVVECNESEAEISELLSEEGFAVKKLQFTTYVLGYHW